MVFLLSILFASGGYSQVINSKQINTANPQTKTSEPALVTDTEPLVLGPIENLIAFPNIQPIEEIRNEGRSDQVKVLTREYYNALTDKMKILVERATNYTVSN